MLTFGNEFGKSGNDVYFCCRAALGLPHASERDNILCPNMHEYKDIDICLGYNEDQTKPAESTLRFVANHFRNHGYRVAFNKPFSNSKTVETDHPYHSLMIEVNKHCYMNEDTLERTAEFDKLHNVLIELQKLLLRP